MKESCKSVFKSVAFGQSFASVYHDSLSSRDLAFILHFGKNVGIDPRERERYSWNLICRKQEMTKDGTVDQDPYQHCERFIDEILASCPAKGPKAAT